MLLTDALLADYSDDEIEVVLAHELAHYVHRDVWKTLAFETVVATLACGAAHWALFRVGPLLGLSGPTDVAGFPVVILAGGAVVVVLTPVANLLSREHERRADQYALAVTGKPEALARGSGGSPFMSRHTGRCFESGRCSACLDRRMWRGSPSLSWPGGRWWWC